MLRLDYFLMRGGLLVNSDICESVDGPIREIDSDIFASRWNEEASIFNEFWLVRTLAPRTNNGKQPMPDDFPIVVNNGRSESSALVKEINHWGSPEIKSWKPDLEKLLEQQDEYDEAQAEYGVMISEKEMMIVDAVNKSKCEPIGISLGICSQVAVRSTDGDYKAGEVHAINGTSPCPAWKYVFSIEEYNQCIREMSEGDFVPNAKPEFVYGQDVYVKDTNFASEAIKFGCLTLEGDSAILLTGGGHMVYPLAGISSKPFKTKEEIELEEAEEKQVLYVATLMNKSESAICDDFSTTYKSYLTTAKALQDAGFLAEILLPLEPKQ